MTCAGSPLANALVSLQHEGTARFAEDCDAALEALESYAGWVIVADIAGGAIAGLDLVRMAMSRDPDLQGVVLFDRPALPAVARAVRDGTSARFFGPSVPAHLPQLVRGLLEVRSGVEARREDRRAFPRVTPPDVAVLEPPNATLVDVTPEGIALCMDDPPPSNGNLRLTLRVAGRLRFTMTAHTVRSVQDALGRWTVAARFTGPIPRATRALQAVVRRQLVAQGPREMQRQFRDSAVVDVVPIAARDHITSLLVRACDERLPITVQAASGALHWRSAISLVAPAAHRFEIDAPPTIAAVAPGQYLDFLLQLEFESYLFEGRLLSTEVPRLSCEFPAVVYYSEKRSRSRIVLDSAEGLRAAIPHPRGDGTQLEFSVIDVGAHGISFVANLDRCVILPGTILDPIRVLFEGDVVLEERGEVRHVTALGTESLFKIGVHFASRRRAVLQSPGPRPTAPESDDPQPRDPLRHSPKIVKFLNSDEEVVVGLLNVTARHAGATGPVVVITPSWGFSKESFTAYSLCLLEAFERARQPAAVLRFDYTHHKGESFVPAMNRLPGREAVDFTLSHAVDDVLAALDFCFSNPIFTPTALVLCGPSFSAPIALRAARIDARVGHLVFPMGTPSTQALVRNASGGLDYFGAFTHGVRSGTVDFLGLLLDMDRGVADAIAHRLAFALDFQEDLSAIEASVSWIAGRYDAWVNLRQVEEALARTAPERTSLSVLEVGHLPTNEDGLVVALEMARSVFRQLGLDVSHVRLSAKDALDRLQAVEWDRAPKATVQDRGEYWRTYLLGKNDTSLGFDVLSYTREYQDLMATQAELLALSGSGLLLDAGTGTGQFLGFLLGAWTGALPQRIEAVDLVSAALDRAKRRVESAPRRQELKYEFRVLNLETSRLTPVQRFLAGEYHRPACLRGRISGLTDELVAKLEGAYGAATGDLVHAACRGMNVAPSDLAFLEPDVRAVVADLGRAARLLKGTLTDDDLRTDRAAEARTLRALGRGHEIHAGHLWLERLDFGEAACPAPLDLPDATYDRILASLVLPYLANADETLAELVRALKSGGRLVASTLKPDTDISRLQETLVERVERGEITPPVNATREWLLQELRAYTGMAAYLLRLTQERTFRFFDASELASLMSKAGLRDLEIQGSFGSPAQAFVIAGRKP